MGALIEVGGKYVRLYRLVIDGSDGVTYDSCLTIAKGPLPLDEIFKAHTFCYACSRLNWRLVEA